MSLQKIYRQIEKGRAGQHAAAYVILQMLITVDDPANFKALQQIWQAGSRMSRQLNEGT
jgi:hypothetical protein